MLSPKNGVRGPHSVSGPPRTALQKARERWAKAHGPKHPALAVDAHALGELGGGGEEGDEDSKEEAAAPAASAPAPAAASPAPSPTAVDAEVEEAEKSADASRRKQRADVLEPDHLVRVVDLTYVFAMVWAFGGNLHDSSRAAFNGFLLDLVKDRLPPLPLPPPPGAEEADGSGAEGGSAAAGGSNDLTQYYVDVETGTLQHWAHRLAPFAYRDGMP